LQNENNFKRALEFTLKWEGGYSFDKSDPGGETKWGISKRSHPDLDIKNLTAQQAADTYANEYWDAITGDDIPFPACVAVFDTAVNCGVDRANQWWGGCDHDVKLFLDKRRDHYVNIINKNIKLMKFAKGWWNRLGDLKKYIDIHK
jgi:hypothetical protein